MILVRNFYISSSGRYNTVRPPTCLSIRYTHTDQRLNSSICRNICAPRDSDISSFRPNFAVHNSGVYLERGIKYQVKVISCQKRLFDQNVAITPKRQIHCRFTVSDMTIGLKKLIGLIWGTTCDISAIAELFVV